MLEGVFSMDDVKQELIEVTFLVGLKEIKTFIAKEDIARTKEKIRHGRDIDKMVEINNIFIDPSKITAVQFGSPK